MGAGDDGRRRHREEEGQGLIEYALILSLVAVILVASVVAFAGGIDTVFTNMVAAF